ncbi:urease accessory protein UreD [Sulfurisphaera javensis]|uniref:Urease accessory protein UreD n=1 Tax=Sulfurisphaera javensis TaxID=2049879 RepID=A0AAT9GSZ6_9CREN
MRGLLEVKGEIIRRKGPLSYLETNGIGIITNPSEVLANDDEIEILIEKESAKITDQAYTKILSKSNVKINIKISSQILFYFPHPVIFYDKAKANILTEIEISKHGKIVEAYVLGRKFHKETFKDGEITSVTKIYYKGKLLIYDVFKVINENYKSKNIMGSEALLTVYEIKDGEYDFQRYSTTTEKIDTLWRSLTGIWF